MELRYNLPIIGLDDCGCCQTVDLERDARGEVYGCHEKSTVLTNREEEILKRIRELSLKAKDTKAKIKEIDTNGVTDEVRRTGLREELASLRQRRSELELERVAAAEERMRLLGHA